MFTSIDQPKELCSPTTTERFFFCDKSRVAFDEYMPIHGYLHQLTTHFPF